MANGQVERGTDELQARVTRLQESIAHERVLLAKLKVSRKRLAGQALHQDLLNAMERDLVRRLAKLRNELQALTGRTM